jgi:hypothetical protein
MKVQASELGSINADYRAYYDAATDEELREEAAWATFAESEFAKLAVFEEPFPECGVVPDETACPRG